MPPGRELRQCRGSPCAPSDCRGIFQKNKRRAAGASGGLSVSMQRANRIKTTGYVVSTMSVILLGVVSWKAASEQPILMACLIIGMLASMLGMLLRWISYQVQKREEEKP